MIFLLSCLLNIAFSQTNYTPDLVNTIQLSKNITYLKQLSNSSIFVQYADGDCYMYDSSFREINKLAITYFLQNIYVSEKQQLVVGYIQNSTYCLQYSLVNNRMFPSIVLSNLITIVYGYAYQTPLCYFHFLISMTKIQISQQFRNQTFNLKIQTFSIPGPSNLKYCIKTFSNTTNINFYCSDINNKVWYIPIQYGYAFFFAATPRNVFTPTTISGMKINQLLLANNLLIIISSYISSADTQIYNYFYNTVTQTLIGYQVGNKMLSLMYLSLAFYSIRKNRIIYFTIDSANNYAFLRTIIIKPVSGQNKILSSISQNANQLQVYYEVNTRILYQFSKCHLNTVFNNFTGICEKRSCIIENCILCNFASNICTTCRSQVKYYYPVSLLYQCRYQSCLKNCVICIDNLTCIQCDIGYQLDSINAQCLLINGFVDNFNYTQITPNYLSNQYKVFPSSIKVIGTICNTTVQYPSFRVYFSFLSQIFGLFDQYWYYIYQQNQMNNLTVTPLFLNFMFNINKDRFTINFIGQQYLQNQVDVDRNLVDRYMNFTIGQIRVIDQDATYFQHNANDLIGFQILFSLVIVIMLYLSVKLIDLIRFIHHIIQLPTNIGQHQIIKKSRLNINQLKKQDIKYQQGITQFPSPLKKNTIFGLIYYFIKEKSNYKVFIAMILEANLIFISFRVGLQLKLLFSFSAINKINIIITLFYGFCAILYSFTFYLLIQKIGKKKSKKNEYLQTLNRTIFLGIKSFSFGFIQSVFINFNQAQLISLILLKFAIIFFILFKPKILQHKILSILQIIYLLSTSFFDMLLLLSKINLFNYLKDMGFGQNQVSNTQYSIIVIILGSVVFKTLFEIYLIVKQITLILNIHISSKVQPVGQNSVKNKQTNQNIIKSNNQKQKQKLKGSRKTRLTLQLQSSNKKLIPKFLFTKKDQNKPITQQGQIRLNKFLKRQQQLKKHLNQRLFKFKQKKQEEQFQQQIE